MRSGRRQHIRSETIRSHLRNSDCFHVAAAAAIAIVSTWKHAWKYSVADQNIRAERNVKASSSGFT
jgi:hypothetical protein